MTKKRIPQSTVRRLSQYLNCLSLLSSEKCREISSHELAERVGVKSTQIRQDFHYFGGFGQPGCRYNVGQLIGELEAILGLDKPQNMIIVGAGNIGQALAHYDKFEPLGFRLKGIFDVNPRLFGLKIRGVGVRDVKELPRFVKDHHIRIGIITTPARVAQSVADLLVRIKIKGIWNFSPMNVTAPEGVSMVNENLSVGLMTLSHKIKGG